MLRFTEDACIQCGLCKATCPEKVITLKPQLDFRASADYRREISAVLIRRALSQVARAS